MIVFKMYFESWKQYKTKMILNLVPTCTICCILLIHFISSTLCIQVKIVFIINCGYLLLSVTFVYTIFAYLVVYLNTSKVFKYLLILYLYLVSNKSIAYISKNVKAISTQCKVFSLRVFCSK